MFTPGPWTYDDGRILDSAGNVLAENVSYENGKLMALAPEFHDFAQAIEHGADEEASIAKEDYIADAARDRRDHARRLLAAVVHGGGRAVMLPENV